MIKLESMLLEDFSKVDMEQLKFYKKLRDQESISKRFQGILPSLLSDSDSELGKGYLVSFNNKYIGYLLIGSISLDERSIYLRSAVDCDERGKSYGKIILKEVTDYIFNNYHEVQFIKLYIADDNIPSINTAKSCGYHKSNNGIYYLENPYYYKENLLK